MNWSICSDFSTVKCPFVEIVSLSADWTMSTSYIIYSYSYIIWKMAKINVYTYLYGLVHTLNRIIRCYQQYIICKIDSLMRSSSFPVAQLF